MEFKEYIVNLFHTYFSVVEEALEEVVDHVINEVIKQGYLVKKGHKMKSLKERWFVLKPTSLIYFTNRTCTEQKGVIVVNKSSSVESVPAKGKYRFSVKCGETETFYELEAKDQKSRLEWVASIQAAIGKNINPLTGLEIATHWSPMRPKIECWRLDFHNWSPAGDSRFVR